jgi:hypothetical protein
MPKDFRLWKDIAEQPDAFGTISLNTLEKSVISHATAAEIVIEGLQRLI